MRAGRVKEICDAGTAAYCSMTAQRVSPRAHMNMSAIDNSVQKRQGEGHGKKGEGKGQEKGQQIRTGKAKARRVRPLYSNVVRGKLSNAKHPLKGSLFSKAGIQKYYHFMMQGEGGGIMFFAAIEFIIAVNSLALAALLYDITVVAFCFMDNHLHIIIRCSEDDCQRFINSFRIRLTKNMMNQRESHGRLGGRGTECVELRTDHELKDAISYCLRNPLRHRITRDIWNHDWSSIRLYFRNNSSIDEGRTETDPKIIRQFIPQHFTFPDDWAMSKSGLIFPQCFVDTTIVERLFHSKGEFSDYLMEITDIEKQNLKEFEYDRPTARHTDKEVIETAKKYLHDEFQCNAQFNRLTLMQKYALADYLHNNALADSSAQIGRILGLPTSTLRYRVRHKKKESTDEFQT